MGVAAIFSLPPKNGGAESPRLNFGIGRRRGSIVATKPALRVHSFATSARRDADAAHQRHDPGFVAPSNETGTAARISRFRGFRERLRPLHPLPQGRVTGLSSRPVIWRLHLTGRPLFFCSNPESPFRRAKPRAIHFGDYPGRDETGPPIDPGKRIQWPTKPHLTERRYPSSA
jgi:hypothetical protein